MLELLSHVLIYRGDGGIGLEAGTKHFGHKRQTIMFGWILNYNVLKYLYCK
jgi:hypothetical protein